MRRAMGPWVATLAVVSLLGTSAAADVVTFKRARGWEAFGGRATDGRRLCGISLTGGGRFFSVKYFEGDSHLTIHATKDTWKVGDGISVDVNLQFDNESPWKASATTFHMDNVMRHST